MAFSDQGREMSSWEQVTMRALGRDFGTAVAILFVGCFGAQAAGSTMWGSNHWLHLMDTDRNGVVSKDEYAHFMRGEFRRLDLNRNGKLEPGELQAISRGGWHPTNA